MAELKDRLRSDLTEAMKSQEKLRTATLRMLLAAIQTEDAFWGMWDSLLADRAHTDDPHLWERAERLGLDVDRFDSDRRSEAVANRVRTDFLSGIRAGVTGTPTAFVGGVAAQGDLLNALREAA